MNYEKEFAEQFTGKTQYPNKMYSDQYVEWLETRLEKAEGRIISLESAMRKAVDILNYSGHPAYLTTDCSICKVATILQSALDIKQEGGKGK